MDSKTLYQKLNVPNFKEIQTEAIEYLKNHPSTIKEGIITDTFSHIPLDDFPILKSFIIPRIKTKVQETSFAIVPPNFETGKHIDGLKKDEGRKLYNQVREVVINHPEFPSLNLDVTALPIANQFVMIIPILNYQDTTSYWYNNDDVADSDEVIQRFARKEYPYNWFLSFVKPEVVVKPIESTQIDCVTFIRSNLFHNVINRGSKQRIAFVIRFFEYQHYDSLDGVFEYRDLT